jgi:hypothetical protein
MVSIGDVKSDFPVKLIKRPIKSRDDSYNFICFYMETRGPTNRSSMITSLITAYSMNILYWAAINIMP